MTALNLCHIWKEELKVAAVKGKKNGEAGCNTAGPYWLRVANFWFRKTAIRHIEVFAFRGTFMAYETLFSGSLFL